MMRKVLLNWKDGLVGICCACPGDRRGWGV